MDPWRKRFLKLDIENDSFPLDAKIRDIYQKCRAAKKQMEADWELKVNDDLHASVIYLLNNRSEANNKTLNILLDYRNHSTSDQTQMDIT